MSSLPLSPIFLLSPRTAPTPALPAPPRPRPSLPLRTAPAPVAFRATLVDTAAEGRAAHGTAAIVEEGCRGADAEQQEPQGARRTRRWATRG